MKTTTEITANTVEAKPWEERTTVEKIATVIFAALYIVCVAIWFYSTMVAVVSVICKIYDWIDGKLAERWFNRHARPATEEEKEAFANGFAKAAAEGTVNAAEEAAE